MDLNAHIPITLIDAELVLRLGAAAVLGLLLGIDRELRRVPAGLRTHGLVCFSAAVMTVSVLTLYHQLGGAESNMDPLRVIEGAGSFLGLIAAGLIVIHKGDVHNLTTAVHLWLAAAIGIACGAGQWPLVVIAAIFGLVMMTVVRLVETRLIEPHLPDGPGTD